MDRRSIALPVLAVVIAMASIQGGAALAKSLFEVIGAAPTAALRLTLAAILMAVVFRPWRLKIERKSWRFLIPYGVSLGVMNLLFYLAIARIPLGVGVALEFTGPLALAVISSRRPLDFLWVAMAVAGLVLLLPMLEFARPTDPLGIAFALGAGACWALYIVFGRRAGATHGMSTAAIGMAFAAGIAAPVGFIGASLQALTPGVLIAALAVAVLSSALPYSLEMAALPKLPTRTFSVLMSVEPVMAALSGLIFLGERLSVLQVGAIGAIIAASAGAALTASAGAARSSVSEMPP